MTFHSNLDYKTEPRFQMLMFWVTDNFLMYKDPMKRRRRSSANLEESLLQRAKVKYRSLRKKHTYSESEILLSGDDEMLDVDAEPFSRAIVT